MRVERHGWWPRCAWGELTRTVSVEVLWIGEVHLSNMGGQARRASNRGRCNQMPEDDLGWSSVGSSGDVSPNTYNDRTVGAGSPRRRGTGGVEVGRTRFKRILRASGVPSVVKVRVHSMMSTQAAVSVIGDELEAGVEDVYIALGPEGALGPYEMDRRRR